MVFSEPATNQTAADATRAVIENYVDDNQLEHEVVDSRTFVVVLPGEHRLKTTVSLLIGEHSLSVNAFVVRHPDEHHEKVYRWLLKRNRRMYAVSYAVDHLGDVYLVGKVPLSAITEDELDRILGSVLENSDGAFDQLLEMGFETAIRKEWQWRLARGESTRNLAAFEHLADHPVSDPPTDTTSQ